MPANLARICGPVSFWNFSAASAATLNAMTKAAANTKLVRFMAGSLAARGAALRRWATNRRPILSESFRSGLADRRLVERRPQPPHELERIVIRPEVHEEHARL